MKRNIKTFLVFLFIFAIIPSVFNANTVNNKHTLILNIEGPAQVYLIYPNGTKIQVGSGIYHFSDYVAVLALAPHGYQLYVNGTEYLLYYSALFNSSTSLIISAIPIYYTLTINFENNGTVELHFLNGTVEVLSTSKTFKVLNNTFAWITSSTPFMVNRNTMVTHYFGENITSNTTWNVIFNPPLPQGYLKINVGIVGNETINIIIKNNTAILTNVTIDHNETFLVPKGYSVDFYSYNNFTVNGKEALYMFGKGYNYYYYGPIIHNTSIIIIFPFKSNISTTQPIATRTLTTNNKSISTSSVTNIQSSSVSIPPVATSINRGESFNRLLIMFSVILIVLILVIIFIIIYRRRIMQRPSPKVRRRPRTR